MRVYLFLNDKIVDFALPKEIVGSFSFDVDEEEDIKLINIEAKNGGWVIYSTIDVSVLSGENNILEFQQLINNSFYILRRRDINYLIYVSDLSLDKISLYSYVENMNIKITIKNEKIILECDKKDGIYINKLAVMGNTNIVNIGDEVNIYALRLVFLIKIVVINNPTGNVSVLSTSNLIKYILPYDKEVPNNLIVRDIELYNKKDYFSKSPRIRTIINEFNLKLSPPPRENNNDDLPSILTIGPMITMGITSGVMMLEVYIKLKNGEVSWKDSWSSLVISGTMLLSMLFWPLITDFYNKRMQKKKRKKLVVKYSKYLNEKREELITELNNQKRILIDNLVTVDECLNIIKNRNMNFWNKRIDQSDFLTVRVGVGNDFFKVNIEYPEEIFDVQF